MPGLETKWQYKANDQERSDIMASYTHSANATKSVIDWPRNTIYINGEKVTGENEEGEPFITNLTENDLRKLVTKYINDKPDISLDTRLVNYLIEHANQDGFLQLTQTHLTDRLGKEGRMITASNRRYDFKVSTSPPSIHFTESFDITDFVSMNEEIRPTQHQAKDQQPIASLKAEYRIALDKDMSPKLSLERHTITAHNDLANTLFPNLNPATQAKQTKPPEAQTVASVFGPLQDFAARFFGKEK